MPEAGNKRNQTKTPEVLKELTGPVSIEEWQWKTWLPVMNFSLAGLAILLSLGWAFKNNSFKKVHIKHDIPTVFKKGQFDFSEFAKWMTPLIKASGKSPMTIIKESTISEESKRYFIELLSANDYKEYSSKKSQSDYKYQSAYFKELGKYIESVGNENSSEPS
jgi:hypothetical protein